MTHFPYNTLVDLLRSRAKDQPRDLAYTFLDDGETESQILLYQQLEKQAQKIAAHLQKKQMAGKTALLLYPPGLDFISAFFGCLYAGVIAVPAYPPDPGRLNRTLPRLEVIVRDSKAEIALTNNSVWKFFQLIGQRNKTASLLGKLPMLRKFSWARHPHLQSIAWLSTDDLPDISASWQKPDINESFPAFIQYTSGSTGSPKGVMLTHRNLLHNQKMIENAFGHNEKTTVVGWLPLYHDMGLIGNVLQPLYLGRPCYLMPPYAFLQKPFRWLNAISRYRATTSGGPNFAYELCMRKISTEQKTNLDLSCWDLAFNGAEPVRCQTIKNFARTFSSCGFREKAFYPCYGLAEASLIVSGGHKKSSPIVFSADKEKLELGLAQQSSKQNSQVFCSSGRSLLDQEIIIADPKMKKQCSDKTIGEIWVKGPSVSAKYWDNDQQSEQTFAAYLENGKGPYLRTGDLGFLDENRELFVTGRIKDLIIIRGRNIYPQDIELAVENCHPALRPGCGAAFSVEKNGEEQLVVIQEVRQGNRRRHGKIIEEIQRTIVENFDIRPHAVVLVKARSIAKTSSGKIQRNLCRNAFEQNKLATAAKNILQQREIEKTTIHAVSILSSPHDKRLPMVEQYLHQQVSCILTATISNNKPLSTFGLDSMAAVELQNHIEHELGIILPFNELLQNNIKELAQLTVNAIASPQQWTPDYKLEKDIPLSIGQKALFFLDKMTPENSAHNIARAARISGSFDIEVFHRAVCRLTKRHHAFRARFFERNGELHQELAESKAVDFQLRAHFRKEELQKDTCLPFDLTTGPLLRIRLYPNNNEHILLMVVHHIISDFWSMEIMMRELEELYEAECNNRVSTLPPVTIHHYHYAHYQNNILQGTPGTKMWQYWQNQLQGELPLLDLPTDFPYARTISHNGGHHSFVVGETITKQLKQLAGNYHATLYMVLLSAYQLLLHRHTSQKDIIIGSPVIGRTRAEFSETIGYFVNMLPIRCKIQGNINFIGLLAQTRSTVLDAIAHQEFPFATMVERLGGERQSVRSPIFQTIFIMQKARSTESLTAFALEQDGLIMEWGGLQLESVPVEQKHTPFEISLTIAEIGDELRGTFHYCLDLFQAESIAALAKNLTFLLESIIKSPGQQVSTMPLLSHSKRSRLERWNETQAQFSGPETIHALFEKQAKKIPQKIALEYDEQKITYRELSLASNRLAHYLKKCNVQPENIVAVAVDRSIDMVIALMAVLKTGAAYLPLDLTHPQKRLAFMLEDSKSYLIITQDSMLVHLPQKLPTTILLDKDADKIAQCSSGPTNDISEQNLAYTIYTSGSTGKPKAVQIEHRSVVNFLNTMCETLEIKENDTLLALTTISFDISVLELFLPLVSGGKVAIVDRSTTIDGKLLAEKLEQCNATIMQATPATWKLLLQSKWPGKKNLKILCGGEVMPPSIAEELIIRCSKLYNLYGPTETTVWSSCYRVMETKGQIPIGRPIANTKIHILDKYLQPVSIGVPGELYIAGTGVARGYKNRPALTAERFIPDPFSKNGTRIYRTGDMACYRPDGIIEFLGRIDNQVKIRGFRIELAEIETTLMLHKSVKEAVVVTHGKELTEKLLVAYILPAFDAIHQETLRTFLQQSLPNYMVPELIIPIDELSLTTSGKIDRKSLPEPKRNEQTSEHSESLSDPVQKMVAAIWQEILHHKEIHGRSNFFTLGGHSLIATKVISRLQEKFDIELSIRSLFDNPTVETMARFIEKQREKQGKRCMAPAPKTTKLEASFGQERLWFLQQMDPNSAAYNMIATVSLQGQLEQNHLEAAFRGLVERHEILRTTFPGKDSPVPVVKPQANFSLTTIDYRPFPQTLREQKMQNFIDKETNCSFDLSKGPLLRVYLLLLEEEKYILLINMHHIISDGWSIGIMVKELAALYQNFQAETPEPLPELPVQYSDFAYRQKQWLQGKQLSRQLEYWQKKLADLKPVNIPLDKPRPRVQTFDGEKKSLIIEIENTLKLKKLGSDYATLFMTLLAAFKILLYRYSRSPEIVVGTPIAGRNHKSTEGLIGFFVNTLVLRTSLDGEANFIQTLEQVRETALGAYAHQELPFEKLVEILQPDRDLNRTPLFQIMFNFFEYDEKGISLPGLKTHLQPILENRSKFDLTVYVREQQETIELDLVYNTDLFYPKTIDGMLEQFARLLQSIVDAPQQRISDLPLIDHQAEQRQIENFNRDSEIAEIDLLDRWQLCCEKYADSIAVEWRGHKITYEQLERESNRLAHGFADLPGEIVVVLVEEKPALVTALLASLKCGKIYTPLNSEFPCERLKQMISGLGNCGYFVDEDCRELAQEISEGSANIISTDQLAQYSDARFKAEHLSDRSHIVFTSGSTGIPKGIVGSRRSLAHVVNWEIETLQVKEHWRVAQWTMPGVDTLLRDVLVPLLTGARVCIPEDKTAILDITRLIAWLRREQISLIHCVPSLFSAIIRELKDDLPALETVVVCGEVLQVADVQKWQQWKDKSKSPARLYNLYGTTETNLAKMHYLVEAQDGERYSIPIGEEMPGVRAVVLDSYDRPCAPGIVGELSLRGFLALGYLDPAKKENRFVANPLSDRENDMIYRTGDLAYRGHDGLFYFVGRKDHQVKLRGIRIELDEIAHHLRSHAKIEQAVVLLRDSQLVAYLTSNGEAPEPGELRPWLKSRLPDFMVPSAFVVLEQLPLLPGGKIDRNALPSLESTVLSFRSFISAETPTEIILVNIWQQVLKQRRIGVEDNFFDIGGHSLLVTQVVNKIRDNFSVDLSLREFFEYPTIKQSAKIIEKMKREGAISVIPTICPLSRDQKLPISFSQERLWFLDQLQPNSSVYNISSVLRIRGNFDIAIFQQALDKVVERHEILRVSFGETEGNPYLIISNQSTPLSIDNIESIPLKERETQARVITDKIIALPFELSRNNLLRMHVIRLNQTEHILVMVVHHIIGDGWSMGILASELMECYRAFSCKQIPVLPELSVQYADFAHWQRQWLKKQVFERQIEFWRNYLENASFVLDLPTDFSRPAVQSYRGGQIHFTIEESLSHKINILTGKKQVTPFMFFLAVYQVLLHKYSRQNSICVGSPVAGRHYSEIENLIGLFINMLVFHADFSHSIIFSQFLDQVRESSLLAYDHQDLPFEQLVEQLQPERDMARSPIFQVMFIFQNVPRPMLQLENLLISREESDSATAKFDLTLSIVEIKQGFSMKWEYNRDLFRVETIERMHGHYLQLLKNIVANPEQQIERISMLSETERKQLEECNHTQQTYPTSFTLDNLFEKQAKETPDKIALIHREQKWSYGILYQRVNYLVTVLREKGAGQEKPVGIFTERSLEMVIGMLAILKAGCAYLPLDPTYPEQRISYMIEDSKTKIILTQEKLISQLPQGNFDLIRLDELEYTFADTLPVYSDEKSLAYVIYTSGSTGKPKAVQIEHRTAVNFLCSMRENLEITDADIWLAITTISFDISLLELFMPLITGGCAVIADHTDMVDGRLLIELMEQWNITVMQGTPATWKLLQQNEWGGKKNLKALCGGETLPPDVAGYLLENCREVYNLYGPTETTVWSCFHKVIQCNKIIPIGRPIANTQIYIMNSQFELMPIGVPGEVFIGGKGLSRGYLNRPMLTAERFVPDPFHKGYRIYRTGDLAYYRPDGVIEFLGRIDNQVKLRGFRIELGEIEAALLEHPDVRQAVVDLQKDSQEKFLIAYIVLNQKKEINHSQWRSLLKNKLPAYMVPSHFVVLEKIPLTPSGKIDRKALPGPQAIFSREKNFIAATTHSQKFLEQIWQSILKLQSISIDDNFFELGGHSLSATRVVAKIRKHFAIDLPLRILFENPTIRLLALQIESLEGKSKINAIERVTRKQRLPLSFAQERLWFLYQMNPESSAYNMPLAIRITGPFQLTAWNQALTKILERHEVLRTVFHFADDQPWQVIQEPCPVKTAIIDLQSLPAPERSERIRKEISAESSKPFRLEQDLLIRSSILLLSEQESILLLTTHHIAADGSIDILLTELAMLYRSFVTKTIENLPELPVQYADFSCWQRKQLQGEKLEKSIHYWQKQLANPSVLELPTDYPRPNVYRYRGANYHFSVKKEITEKLDQLAHEQGVSLFMLILTAFKILLHKYSGQIDIIVGSPINDRSQWETEHLVGCFVNTLVLRTIFKENPTFLDLLESVRQTTFDAYTHKDIPFEMLVEKLAIERSLSHTPLFQAMFVLQHSPLEKIEMPDLDLQRVQSENKRSRFDLLLGMWQNENNLTGSLEYNTDLFRQTTIERMVNHFQILLALIAQDPNRSLAQCDVMHEEETRQRAQWNETRMEVDEKQTIHSLFEEKARQYPDSKALIFRDDSLCYRELNALANQLAHHLLEQKVKKGDLVAVMMDRCMEMIPAVMAIVKTGAAYVPIDVRYPEQRVQWLLNSLKINYLISCSFRQSMILDLAPQLPDLRHVMFLDSKNQILPEFSGIRTWHRGDLENLSRENPARNITADDLCYIIFTSGSTGIPKGVTVFHRTVVNVIDWVNKTFSVDSKDKLLFITSLCFDLSVYDIFGILAAGGSIRIADSQEVNDPQKLLAILDQEEITFWDSAPAALQQLIPLFDKISENKTSLRLVFLSGDWIPVRMPEQLHKRFPGVKVVSLGGATEATIWSNYFPINEVDPDWTSIPYGKPIQNARYYILDRHFNHCPIGVPGDLYIGGQCLALGYIQAPTLTASKYMPDPFSDISGARMYATGDRARYWPDGNIEFLGRLDHQVKIRGFRIELGEIETILSQHPDIREIIVVARGEKRGDKILIAYPVLQRKEANIAEIKLWLQEKLPEYMVPSVFISLENIPLTASGKVDYKGLPAPDQAMSSKEFVEPSTPTQKAVAKIWSEVLKIDKVSIEDNFFELGGHSLLATQIVTRIRKEFSIDFPLHALFEAPDVAKLSEQVENFHGKNFSEQLPLETHDYNAQSELTQDMDLENLSDDQVEKLLKEMMSDDEEEEI